MSVCVCMCICVKGQDKFEYELCESHMCDITFLQNFYSNKTAISKYNVDLIGVEILSLKNLVSYLKVAVYI